MKWLLIALTLFLSSCMSGEPKLISAKKIWSESDHSAFTDLIRFKNRWYCVFRESDEHFAAKDGTIRLLSSSDGSEWISITVIEEEGVDLRDPKLSITPDNRLMLLVGGLQFTKEEKYVSGQTQVAFSDNGINWSPFKRILQPHDWLWRVTWHEGKAYGVAYRPKEWTVALYESDNGVDYTKITDWEIPGHPNEATLRFLPDNTMIALVRRGHEPEEFAWIGKSHPPYTEWEWHETDLHLGGPDFIVTPGGKMWASGRTLKKLGDDEYLETVILAEMTEENLFPTLKLPSGGEDTGYPGMVFYKEKLWISYYSSHIENKSSIYLAEIKLF